MDSPEKKREARVLVTRGYTLIEDIVYIGLGLLLACIVLVLLVSSFVSFGRSALHAQTASSLVGLLDQILLILLIVELLYTVQVSFRAHGLVPEPFLLVGLISGIRRILVLTAEFGKQHEQGLQVPLSLIIELAVLAGLILSLAISLMLVRKKGTEVEVHRV